MWWMFFAISLCSLLLPTAVLAVINNVKRENKAKIRLINGMFAGVFVANIFVFLPAQLIAAEANFWGAWRAFLLSVFQSMQVFTIGCEFSVVKDCMVYCPDALDIWYQVWAASLYVLAPILTFGFVLSLFKNISAVFHLKNLSFRKK